MLRHFRGGPGAGSDFVKDLAAELGISEDKVTEALKATRPALPEGGWRRDGHGPGGPPHGFGPPPGMDGGWTASGTVTEVAPAPVA